MTVAEIVGTVLNSVSFDAPVLTHALPSNGACTAGSVHTLLVMGANFEAAFSSPTIEWSASVCRTSAWVASTVLLCQSSAGTIDSPSLVVTMGASMATRSELFTFDAPVISEVHPRNGPTYPLHFLTALTFAGSNFGPSFSSPSLMLGSSVCSAMAYVSGTSLRCSAPRGTGAGLISTATISLVVGTSMQDFTFDAPCVTALGLAMNTLTIRQVANGPSSLGSNGALLLSGANFGGHSNSTPAAQLVGGDAPSGALCGSTGWSTPTSVRCWSVSSQPRQAPGYIFSVRVGTLVGTSATLMTFDAPVVTEYGTVNAASTSDSPFALLGLNFGPSDLTPSVQLGLSLCSSVSWSSATLMLCATLGGSGPGISTFVTASAVVGTYLSSVTFDAPVISIGTPPNTARSTAMSITMSGFNFGDGQAAMGFDPTPTVALAASPCACASWHSTTMLLCHARLKVQLGIIGSFTLTVARLVSSATSLLTFDAPVASSVLSATNIPLTGGRSFLSLRGLNFGSADATATAATGLYGLCQTMSWTAATAVSCLSARMGGTSSITVASAVATLETALSFDSPVLSTVALSNTALTGGASLTLLGFNFAEADLTATIAADVYPCATTSWTSTTSARCRAGSAARSSHVALVAVLTGTAAVMLSYDAAVVSLASPNNIASSGSAQVTLAGLGFGQANSSTVAELDGVGWSLTTSWASATSLLLTLADSDPRSSAAVTVSALASSSSRWVSFDAPVLSNVPSNIRPGMEVALTLVGLNFRARNVTPSIMLSALLCRTTAWTAASSVTCISSATQGTGTGPVDLQMHVATDSKQGIYTRTALWTFDAPVLSWHQGWNGPTTGGVWITGFGFNFGSTMRVSIGESACLTSSWTSGSSVLCGVGVGTGASRVVSGHLIADSIGTSAAYFSYAPPVISHLAPVTGESIGGTVIFLSGASLGADVREVQISVGSTLCTAVTVTAADQQLSCTTGPGHGDGLAVIARINGQVACLASPSLISRRMLADCSALCR